MLSSSKPIKKLTEGLTAYAVKDATKHQPQTFCKKRFVREDKFVTKTVFKSHLRIFTDHYGASGLDLNCIKIVEHTPYDYI